MPERIPVTQDKWDRGIKFSIDRSLAEKSRTEVEG